MNCPHCHKADGLRTKRTIGSYTTYTCSCGGNSLRMTDANAPTRPYPRTKKENHGEPINSAELSDNS